MIKPFVALEEAICNLKTAPTDAPTWLCCIVCNVGDGRKMCGKQKAKSLILLSEH